MAIRSLKKTTLCPHEDELFYWEGSGMEMCSPVTTTQKDGKNHSFQALNLKKREINKR